MNKPISVLMESFDYPADYQMLGYCSHATTYYSKERMEQVVDRLSKAEHLLSHVWRNGLTAGKLKDEINEFLGGEK